MRAYALFVLGLLACLVVWAAITAALAAAWDLPAESIVPDAVAALVVFGPLVVWAQWRKRRGKELYDRSWENEHPFGVSAILTGGITLVAIPVALTEDGADWLDVAELAAFVVAFFVLLAAMNLIGGWARRRRARRAPADRGSVWGRLIRGALITMAAAFYGLLLLVFVVDLVDGS